MNFIKQVEVYVCILELQSYSRRTLSLGGLFHHYATLSLLKNLNRVVNF